MKWYFSVKCSTLAFWNKSPALRIAIAFLIGIASTFHLGYLFVAIVLFLFEKKLFTLLILGAGYLYSFLLYPDPMLDKPTSGSGIFHIQQVKRHPTPFNPLLVYEGTLRTFQTENQTFHRLPCRLYMPVSSNRQRASQDYFLPKVSLMETRPRHFVLKTNDFSSWVPVKHLKSQAEWRFQAKERVRLFAKKVLHQRPVQELIAGLLTGQTENRLQTFQFGQVGLQHLLAISGFHFAILTFFLAFLLRRFLPRKLMALVLISLLSFYFYYMGEAPSISRAWIGVLVFLGGMLLERQTAPLNALGIGLLSALFANPLIVLNVGFQLSFAATCGILLFYRPFEAKMQGLFPKRSMKALKNLRPPDQWGSILSTYLRKIIALNLAVTLFTLPILLVHFHQFPLISLLYNLFFPFLFSLLISLLLLSLLLPFLFPLLESYSSFLLLLINHAPKRLMFTLHVPNFPEEIAIFICLALFLWGAYLNWSSSVIKEWQLT